MHARPEAAAEVLLALIIEDEPVREHTSARYEADLQLKFTQEAYPTVFWKSPFFQLLQIAPDVALGALIGLVNFCTERWIADVMRGSAARAPGVMLQLADGEAKTFDGWWQVFDWTQENSLHNGNLFSALDALERWLTLQLDAEANVTGHIERIFQESSTAAVLGLLVNVGSTDPRCSPTH